MQSGRLLAIIAAILLVFHPASWSLAGDEDSLRSDVDAVFNGTHKFRPLIPPLPGGPKSFLIDPNANLDRSEFPPSETKAERRFPGVIGWLEPTYEGAQDFVESTFDVFSLWTKRIEFGARFIDGNSNQDFLSTAGRFENRGENWLGQLEFNGERSESNGKEATNRWNGNVTYDYGKHGKWIVFATAKNEYDEFEGLDYRGTYSSGLGYRFLNEENRRLIARVGPGVTYEQFADPDRERTTPDAFGELEVNLPIFRRSSFESKTTVHPSVSSLDVFRVISQNGFLFKIDEHGAWRIKLGFRFDYNSRPNKNRLPADYTTNVLLVYTQP